MWQEGAEERGQLPRPFPSFLLNSHLLLRSSLWPSTARKTIHAQSQASSASLSQSYTCSSSKLSLDRSFIAFHLDDLDPKPSSSPLLPSLPPSLLRFFSFTLPTYNFQLRTITTSPSFSRPDAPSKSYTPRPLPHRPRALPARNPLPPPPSDQELLDLQIQDEAKEKRKQRIFAVQVIVISVALA